MQQALASLTQAVGTANRGAVYGAFGLRVEDGAGAADSTAGFVAAVQADADRRRAAAAVAAEAPTVAATSPPAAATGQQRAESSSGAPAPPPTGAREDPGV